MGAEKAGYRLLNWNSSALFFSSPNVRSHSFLFFPQGISAYFANRSTFDYLIADLTRDINRAQPRDALQFCANWFNTRLQEQRTRIRDIFEQGNSSPVSPHQRTRDESRTSTTHTTHIPPPSPNSPTRRPSNHSPFGRLEIPGNAAANGDGAFLGPPPSALGRRVSVSAESLSPSSGPERPPPFFVKSPEQLKRLEESIKDAFLFRKLDNKKRAAVLGAMKEMHFGPYEAVITQGDDGDYFYIVDSGTLDCYKRSPDHDAPTSSTSTTTGDWHPVYGKKVFAYTRGGTFGELALMYYAKRAATVVTTSPCTLWALDRVTFQTILLDISARTRRSYETFLASVPLLQSLNDGERAKLADVLQPREFADGEVVVHEGELGKEFYIVEEGEAEVLKKVRNQQGLVVDEVVKKYKRGDYFGGKPVCEGIPHGHLLNRCILKSLPYCTVHLVLPPSELLALQASQI
jgi:cAMP-dependent protein kinase regulator